MTTKFKPGQSGNPKGKPKGTLSQSTRLRQAIENDLPQVIGRLRLAALDGDVGAARVLIDRCLPPVRAESVTVNIPALSSAETPSDKARAIIDAIANGLLPPSVGCELLRALGTACEIIEMDELEKRLTIIESILENDNGNN